MFIDVRFQFMFMFFEVIIQLKVTSMFFDILFQFLFIFFEVIHIFEVMFTSPKVVLFNFIHTFEVIFIKVISHFKVMCFNFIFKLKVIRIMPKLNADEAGKPFYLLQETPLFEERGTVWCVWSFSWQLSSPETHWE